MASPLNFSLPAVRKLIMLALEEDIGAGDLVSSAVFPRKHHSKAKIIAREPLTVCGLPLIEEIVRCADSSIKVKILMEEGTRAKNNDVMATLSGSTAEILTLERTILNFIQRLSGIATNARRWVTASRGIVILDTRKTLPGYRLLDKYATRIAGVQNHRMNLSSMAMIKNNHIDALKGGILKVVELVRAKSPLGAPLEIEVRDVEELRDAIDAKPSIIMLDNMSDREIEKAIRFAKARKFGGIIEISGGVKLERLPKLRRIGVTHVSIGALTHSVRAADISLRMSK